MSDEVKAAMIDGAKWFDENSAKVANQDYFDKQYWPKFKEGGLEVIDPDQAMLDRFAEVSVNVRDAWVSEVGGEVGKKAIALAMGEAS